ncbi:MAG: restriction endonuclease [Candidatus Gastranaerophilaceae bacterium]
MAIPDFQTLMLPVLKILGDNQEHKNSDIVEAVASQFNLSEEERNALLPSGGMTYIYNRTLWAKTYLKKAGLVYHPQRGLVKITEKGLEVLSKNPEKINMKFLNQFDEYNEWRENSKHSESTSEEVEECEESMKTPEEMISDSMFLLNKTLADDLMDKIAENSPMFFENLVAELLLKMGYGSSKQDILQNAGRSGDEGIDGIIKEDVLGLDKIYIQAKRWQGTVGRPEIQKFAGALQMQNASKGIFITTSNFSKDAIDCINKFNSNLVLIDGKKLTELMIRYNLGVTVKQTYEVKKIDEDFFLDET